MIRRLALLVFGLSCALIAAENQTAQRVQVTRTEHLDFVPSGMVNFRNSVDELTVEGWDRTDVEIITVASTKQAYGSGEREGVVSRLSQVRLAASRHGDQMVVTTELPHRRWNTLGDLYLESRIRVPRASHLIVKHRGGEVHVVGIAGDLNVRVARGSLTLSLPPDGKYDIDARSDFGGVISDLPGNAHRRFWLTGNQFLETAPANATKLRLRIGYGDIEILRMRAAVAPAGPNQ